MRDSHKLKDTLNAGSRKNRTGAQTRTLRHISNLAVHYKTATQALQNLSQATAFLRNDAASQQTSLLQRKGIIGIAGSLQRFDRVKLAMHIHVTAVEYNLFVRYFLHTDFHRTLSIKQDRSIQYRTALLNAVRRGIRPTATPVDTQRQPYHMLIRNNFRLLVIL